MCTIKSNIHQPFFPPFLTGHTNIAEQLQLDRKQSSPFFFIFIFLSFSLFLISCLFLHGPKSNGSNRNVKTETHHLSCHTYLLPGPTTVAETAGMINAQLRRNPCSQQKRGTDDSPDLTSVGLQGAEGGIRRSR
ncbi:hypothetical protein P170DRAFT_83882 [Aspergillus steynii IBT 23096]|uniref:Uncharacterized protein n=1 Tax=Aspergillus steynii IBT 23096 TaxID=1392250 RepID=A0A2I2GFQ6_9EURO|nr:uncharacterized protein P170DRAFT_83882 [Aspergillus steynii IBT 23096]PLB51716.1 hypothetical protein P170DRAFT_83882 [Aspergillus steynii IBT 23096]